MEIEEVPKVLEFCAPVGNEEKEEVMFSDECESLAGGVGNDHEAVPLRQHLQTETCRFSHEVSEKTLEVVPTGMDAECIRSSVVEDHELSRGTNGFPCNNPSLAKLAMSNVKVR